MPWNCTGIGRKRSTESAAPPRRGCRWWRWHDREVAVVPVEPAAGVVVGHQCRRFAGGGARQPDAELVLELDRFPRAAASLRSVGAGEPVDEVATGAVDRVTVGRGDHPRRRERPELTSTSTASSRAPPSTTRPTTTATKRSAASSDTSAGDSRETANASMKAGQHDTGAAASQEAGELEAGLDEHPSAGRAAPARARPRLRADPTRRRPARPHPTAPGRPDRPKRRTRPRRPRASRRRRRRTRPSAIDGPASTTGHAPRPAALRRSRRCGRRGSSRPQCVTDAITAPRRC